MPKQLFEQFRKNISVQNASEFSASYESITTRLNKDFWETDSSLSHRLQVGSYGRNTAIHGISDLDMLFELPPWQYDRYKAYADNGPSQLLQAVRKSLRERYPTTAEIKGDGQVVVISFAKYVVEVLPAFRQDDGSYIHPNSNNGGSWPATHPRAEIEAMDARNAQAGGNLKRVCKMLRAWKNEHGVHISGYLIDTLCYNFFGQTNAYNVVSYNGYPALMCDLFNYLTSLDHQDYWLAPGSRQRVPNGKFQRKAKKAAVKCNEALSEKSVEKQAKIWREVFGRAFPLPNNVTKSASFHENIARASTEEFIEDAFPVDISFDLTIDCKVLNGGLLAGLLKRLSQEKGWTIPTGRKLKFFIEECDVPPPFEVRWKVRNVGPFAESRESGIRGQILRDDGSFSREETSSFSGTHYVECFVIKGGKCVARDRVDVPI